MEWMLGVRMRIMADVRFPVNFAARSLREKFNGLCSVLERATSDPDEGEDPCYCDPIDKNQMNPQEIFSFCRGHEG